MNKLLFIFIITFPFVMNAQMTYIPDDNFEQTLIDKGYDYGPLNDSVPTFNIDGIWILKIEGKGISDLTGIQDFISLEWLMCSDNNIKSLDLRKSPYLQMLVCYNNDLTSLDVSNNTALQELRCFSNELTSLDLRNNTSLVKLALFDNKLTNLDVRNNPALELLDCSDNHISSLDLRYNPSLMLLYCYENQLTSLDISNNLALDWLVATDNPDLNCIRVIDSSKAANNNNWRKDSSAIYSEDCGYVGVDENKNEFSDVSISPNPATDYIEISIQSEHIGSPLQDITIYNSLGECVMNIGAEQAMPLQRINISALPPGLYFININFGKEMHNESFLVLR